MTHRFDNNKIYRAALYCRLSKDDDDRTGDSSSMVLWITLMFIAVCGLSGAMVYGRKKKYGK